MRILWVLPSLKGTDGTIIAAMAAPVLQQQGWELDVLPLSAVEPSESPYPFPDDVEIMESPLLGRFRGREGAIKGLFRRLNSYYDRIIVDQTFDLEFQALMAGGTQALGSRTILIAHRSPWELEATRGHRANRLKALMRLWYPQASQIITVSGRIYDDLIQNFNVPGWRMSRVFLPLAAHGFSGERPRELPPSKLILAVFGRLNVFKGLEGFLMAARTLYDQGHTFQVVVLGDGPSLPAGEHLAQSLELDGLFVRWPPNPLTWVQACDFLVAPQYLDTSGLDVQMAMYSRVPVLGYRSSSPAAELISAYGGGELTEIAKPWAMAELLSCWLCRTYDRQRYRGVSDEVRVRLFGAPARTAWIQALTG